MGSAAATGFRVHSGWAAAVALTGSVQSPAVVLRRRIEMGEAQPYHAAAKLEPGEAGELIARARTHDAELATAGLRRLAEDLRTLGHDLKGCAILRASGRPLPELKIILGSHALIHTAEGEHFRDAFSAACAELGLRAIQPKERELIGSLARALRQPEARVEQQLSAMGKSIGPPWRQDQKFAGGAAWLILAS